VTLDTLPSFDFAVERGDSVTIELGPVATRDRDGVEQPVDLTLAGTKMWLTVKASHDDPDPGLVQLTEASGITLNSPATAAKNYATAFIGEDVFDDPAAYAKRTILVWDAVLEQGTRHERIARGKLIVVPSATRAT